MVHKKPFVHDQQEDSTSTPENVADDSALSGDEAYEVNAPSPKKRFNSCIFTLFLGLYLEGLLLKDDRLIKKLIKLFFFVFLGVLGGVLRRR